MTRHAKDAITRRHRRHRVPFSFALALCVAGGVGQAMITSSPALGAQSGAKTRIIWCADNARRTVRKRAAWQCEGVVVSEAEAQTIKQSRKRRVQRSLDTAGGPRESGRASGSPSDEAAGARPPGGTGTGFFVTRRGAVLTNEHVIRDCGTLTVTPAGRGERPARVIAREARRDLALLDAGPTAPDYARFRAGDEVRAGERLTVVGYPLNGLVTITPQLVEGQLYTNTRDLPDDTFAMQMDVRRGNSGGPVLDANGDVVGVVFAKVDTPKVFARTGKLIKNVGLAVSNRVATEFLRRHGIRAPIGGAAGGALTRAERLERASEFVVQIRCWK